MDAIFLKEMVLLRELLAVNKSLSTDIKYQVVLKDDTLKRISLIYPNKLKLVQNVKGQIYKNL